MASPRLSSVLCQAAKAMRRGSFAADAQTHIHESPLALCFSSKSVAGPGPNRDDVSVR